MPGRKGGRGPAGGGCCMPNSVSMKMAATGEVRGIKIPQRDRKGVADGDNTQIGEGQTTGAKLHTFKRRRWQKVVSPIFSASPAFYMVATDGGADGGILSEIMTKHGRSAQPESQQLVAVTRAVCEVVAAEKLQVTPTSLFAATMSALERPETQAAPQVRVRDNIRRDTCQALICARYAMGKQCPLLDCMT